MSVSAAAAGGKRQRITVATDGVRAIAKQQRITVAVTLSLVPGQECDGFIGNESCQMSVRAAAVSGKRQRIYRCNMIS